MGLKEHLAIFICNNKAERFSLFHQPLNVVAKFRYRLNDVVFLPQRSFKGQTPYQVLAMGR